MSRRWYLLISSSLIALQWLFLAGALERPAYGYVDPGSGMLVVQFVGSVLSGGIFFLSKRLKQLFISGKPTQVPQGTNDIES